MSTDTKAMRRYTGNGVCRLFIFTDTMLWICRGRRVTKTVSLNGIPEDEKHRERLKRRIVKVSDALHDLNDRQLLNRSPLARLTYVQEFAKEHYQDALYPRGIALREILVYCIDRIVNEMSSDPGLSRPC